MANEVMASIQEKQEKELSSYLFSIDSAKWSIYENFRFAYGVDMEFHELELYLNKLAQELKLEQEKQP